MSHGKVTVAPYGMWSSPVDPTTLFERPSAPQYPACCEGRYYWVEARAFEGGRTVLVRREPDGSDTCLTPAGYSIRTRVHEYGGRCFVLSDDVVYFSNDADARLYVQRLEAGAEPRPVTNDDGRASWFADLAISPERRFLLAVMERSHPQAENENMLVAIALDGSNPVAPVPVASGADFYACPAVDDVSGRLSWLEWDHPDMPWDRTRLMSADIDEGADGLSLRGTMDISGRLDGAICQPRYYQGALVFAADVSAVRDDCDDFWNLYQYDGGSTVRLTCELMEYGAPHWVFGEFDHAPLNAGTLLASRTSPAGDELVEIDRRDGRQRIVDSPLTSFSQLNPGRAAGEVVMVAGSATESPALVSYLNGGFAIVKSQPTVISGDDISLASPVIYPTRDGGSAHAYYYVPQNSRYAAPEGQRPPLLVMVHGGPTSRSTAVLDLMRQYWTGCGFAVLDVNHRGSTGYGRRYRQHLLGRWGCVDVDDVIDGIDFLVEQSLVDPGRVFIRGKSAGGYAVLRALTEYPDYFAAGGCYYGIGNLSTLASITHKFEARYTDRLIGEAYDPVSSGGEGSAYYQRSPVNFMHRLKSPMILFQGLEDRVVPPAVSREVAAALAERDIEHEYVEYPGEGHGFRSSETNIDAIKRETNFYRRFLGVTP